MTWDGRIRADARQLPLADQCVQCVVTSPPYWGLRDYGQEGQIGLEKTPEAYVDSLREVFREVWRVLKNDGTLWLNLGDCYATGAGKVGDHPGGGQQGAQWKGFRGDHPVDPKRNSAAIPMGPMTQPNRMPQAGLKPKDLVGMPWRVAFALQADGWYLRRDIVWAKPNPMPESVTDRPTTSHEYIFLLTKNERYYYNAGAIAEPCVKTGTLGHRQHGNGPGRNPEYRNMNAKHRQTEPQAAGHRMVDNVATARAAGAAHDNPFGDTRNKRSVWTISTRSYPGAHYAVFPEELAEICIRAGSHPFSLVMDPFFGSGTVGRVAERLNRRWIGCDLGYQHLQEKRLTNIQKELVCFEESGA